MRVDSAAVSDYFCSGCGRKMVERYEDEGFDTRTGEKRRRKVWVCPRFDRSWRNLWCGGWRHTGTDGDLLELRWL